MSAFAYNVARPPASDLDYMLDWTIMRLEEDSDAAFDRVPCTGAELDAREDFSRHLAHVLDELVLTGNAYLGLPVKTARRMPPGVLAVIG